MSQRSALLGTLSVLVVLCGACSPADNPDDAAGETPCDTCGDDQVCLGGRCVDEPACGCEFGEYCDQSVGDLCVPGCRTDADCGLGALCDDGQCIAGCHTDAMCAVGSACVGGRCARGCALTECDPGAECEAFACADVGPASCEADTDCGYLWRCSDAGTCARCLSDVDCPAHLVCSEAACVPGETPLVTFEVVDLGELNDHGQSYLGPDDVGYGAGATLFDMDGDGDLDVALGRHAASDPAVCVYENLSTPGSYRFERVEGVCDLQLPGRGLVGADLDRDGTDELVVLDERSIVIVRVGREPRVVTLFNTDDAAQTGLDCAAGSAVPVDLDLDGDLDLYIGCQTEFDASITDVTMRHNLAFEQLDDGSFARIDLPLDDPLVGSGVTLAIAVVDLDDDGLLDMVLANDSYSTVGRRNTDLEPGIRLHRCGPADACDWRATNFTHGEDSWGSFMGVGYLRIDDAYYVYVSDWGPNRMMASSVDETDDVAAAFDLELARREGYNLFGWSVVVDDYDRDGRDDLLVSHGMVPDPTVPRGQYVHANELALQVQPARFASWSDGTGLLQPADRRSTSDDLPASSRAVLRGDLDQDGTLDLLMTTYAGYPEAYAEVPAIDVPPRCTLRPVTRIVHSHGYGFGVRSEPGDPWRFYDIQGHIRSGSASSIVTSMSQGQVRFPSGAIVSFDCSTGPVAIEVDEPSWIERVPATDEPRFQVSPDWLDGDAIVSIRAVERTEAGGIERDVARDPVTDQYFVVGANPNADIMMQVNGRWVQRWFAAP